MSGAARILAKAAAATRWSRLPHAVRIQAEDLLIDTIAVIAAGAVHPSFRPWALAQEKGDGACTVIGTRRGAPMGNAALANGGATTVLQWQDGHRVARGHPAAHLVPALLALGEARGVSAEAFMSAFVAGYEAGVRIGAALNGLNEFLHDAGGWSTIGAAVAAMHLISDGEANAIEAAIEAAASVAPMLDRRTCSAGAPVHHLYIGLGAQTALTAALGVEAGLTPLEHTLEAYFGPRAGARFRPDLLADGAAESGWTRFEILNGYIKWHPICAHLSGAADALARLVTKHGPLGDGVEAVDIAIYGAAMEYDCHDPRTDLAARFSLRAVTAAMLDTGRLDSADFGALLAEPDFRARMERVRVRHDPALDEGYPAGRPTKVEIRLKDGRVLTDQSTLPYGDSANPLAPDDRRIKATRLLARAYEQPDLVLDAVTRFLAGEPISLLSSALRMSIHPG